MPEETRASAEKAAKLVETVNAVVLAEPKADIVPLAKAKGNRKPVSGTAWPKST